MTGKGSGHTPGHTLRALSGARSRAQRPLMPSDLRGTPAGTLGHARQVPGGELVPPYRGHSHQDRAARACLSPLSAPPPLIQRNPRARPPTPFDALLDRDSLDRRNDARARRGCFPAVSRDALTCADGGASGLRIRCAERTP